jgi:hypothetical protein
MKEKLDLLREMLAVSNRQTELLAVEDENTDTAGPLEAAVHRRENLIAAIDALDAQTTPADADPAIQAEIRSVVADIIQNDEKNRQVLEAALQKTGGDIARLRGVRKQITAYGGGNPAEAGQRFDSTQ